MGTLSLSRNLLNTTDVLETVAMIKGKTLRPYFSDSGSSSGKSENV